MMQALTNLSAYQTSRNITDDDLKTIVDINNDGSFTNADIQSLLNQIKNGGSSSTSVPEPGSLVLALGCLTSLIAGKRFTVGGWGRVRLAHPC
jgi:hypothetical protein